MNTQSFFIILVLLFCIQACSENKDAVYLKDFSYTECQTNRSDLSLDDSSITYKAVNESTLKVEIKNLSLNCALEKINIDMSHSENDHISINIQAIGDDANCVCPRNLTYEIGNLVQGKSYSCTITKNGINYTSFDFTTNTNEETSIK